MPMLMPILWPPAEVTSIGPVAASRVSPSMRSSLALDGTRPASVRSTDHTQHSYLSVTPTPTSSTGPSLKIPVAPRQALSSTVMSCLMSCLILPTRRSLTGLMSRPFRLGCVTELRLANSLVDIRKARKYLSDWCQPKSIQYFVPSLLHHPHSTH